MDLADFLHRKNAWSLETFGPSQTIEGVIEHARKELDEASAEPCDAIEWADVLFLVTDAAFRAGHTPEAICEALEQKLAINRARSWPDYRTADMNAPIEHVREG